MAEKQLKMGSHKNVFSDKMLEFPIGRAYFVNLAKPTAQYKKYQMTVLYPKDDKAVQPALKKMKEDYLRLMAFKYGENETPKITHPPIWDGDKAPVSQDDSTLMCEKYKEFKNCYFIRIQNPEPIRCVDTNKKDISPSSIFPGVKVKGAVQGTLFESPAGKGISWKGLVIMLVEDDGTRWYTGPDPTSILTAVGEDTSVQEAADEVLGKADTTSEKKKGKEAAVDLL